MDALPLEPPGMAYLSWHPAFINGGNTVTAAQDELKNMCLLFINIISSTGIKSINSKKNIRVQTTFINL